MKRITLCALLMILFLLLSCGSGHQSANGGGAATGGSSLSSVLMDVGRSAENAFYSFLELLSDTLGFRITKDTKKSDVASYFNSLGDKLGQASDELEKVAVKTTAGSDKDSLLNKVIKDAVDSAKTTLNTLKTHLDSLKDIGDNDKVGDAASNAGQGTTPADNELKKALKALQEIVKSAKEKGVKEPEAGITTLQANGGADNKDGAKILSTNGAATATDAGKAAAILATVSGEEILASIVASQEDDQALGVAADANTTALKFAKGGSADNLSNSANSKAAAVAGGIALRSLVKTGKLAAGADDNATGGGKEVQGVGITAANKLLVAVEDIIKETVKNVLKTAKEKIDEARAPKEAAQQ
ncbi:variable large family protein [Borrelia puertoricensis]|uniref:variable large family protein n=1 Tax=Borrelia puertoricensis TaxID=2756107 RepID=UPI001FF6AF9D|nr:variable large family protein [Borrelia puertoricensis]UPA19330.1 variable large family protein [Borrelia puertoricensis]